MMTRERFILTCCWLALRECWETGITDRETFIDLVIQYGARKEVVEEEVKSLMSESIVRMLEEK